MKIRDIYKNQKCTVSFEFFPPKTEEAEVKLFETALELKSLAPSFISVTYGAMGNTRSNTLRIVSRIKREIGIEAAAHLTCVAHTREEIEKILLELKENGIENLVALRGDPPKGEATFKPIAGGFAHAGELVRYIKQQPRFAEHFSLAVAGYPEGHPECRDLDKDLDHLKWKVDGGADAIVTQLFFDNEEYFRFCERAVGKGIKIPIVPGIMPVTQGPQIEKFSIMCGAKIPAELKTAISKYGDDQDAVSKFGIDFATRQCQQLIDGGAPGLHFYTLNKSSATQQIFRRLSL